MCQRLTSPPRGPFLLGARAPAQDAKRLWFSVRRRWSSLLHPSRAALAPFFKVKVTSPRASSTCPLPHLGDLYPRCSPFLFKASSYIPHSFCLAGGVPTARSPRAAPLSLLSPRPNPWVLFSTCKTHIPTAFYAPRVLHDLGVLSSYSSWRQKKHKNNEVY